VQQVRRAAQQSRVGHTGTLDPAATGVLVVCLGRATRLVRFLQAGTKTYAAGMVLGVETDSQDAEGAVLRRVPAGHIDERRVCEELARFQGPISQVPPMVSAVRVGGQRLHELARRGEHVEREARQVVVHDLILDAFVPGEHPEVSFLVTCSAGTYVRTIAHDVGTALGVGASLHSLRRLANGPFLVEEAHPPERVTAAGTQGLPGLLVPPLTAIERILPMVEVGDPELVLALARGAKLPAQGREGPYGVRSGERLIGIYADRGGVGRAELVWTRPEELA
jgi:tRNA pseudouridine55 synthase